MKHEKQANEFVREGNKGMSLYIEQVPRAFCEAKECRAWNAKKERCNARRWQEECDHPEASEAGKYAGR